MQNDSLRPIDITALIVTIVGALNWLLVGLFAFDLVATLFADGFGTTSVLSRIVYVIVGLAGIWLAFSLVPRLANVRYTPHAAEPAT